MAPTDQGHLIRTIHHPTLRPARPLSFLKARPTAEEEDQEASEAASLVPAGEGVTEEGSRILNGPLALEVEGVNMPQVQVTRLMLRNVPPNIPRAHRLATTPRLPTTITPFAPRKICK